MHVHVITYECGSKDAEIVLVQPVDNHDFAVIEDEIRKIAELTQKDFRLIAVKVDCWNDDLSPWKAPAVYGKDGFGGSAKTMLDRIVPLCQEADKKYYLGGYSLSGLFSLWAGFQMRFAGIAAASPSMWFPGFTDYMEKNQPLTDNIYLSLGDKEEKTRNRVMATVGDCIRKGFWLLKEAGIHCTLEWNSGNHFYEPEIRMAKAFAWLINHE